MITKVKYNILGFFWRFFPSQKLKTIQEFFFIEDDSHWQIMQFIESSTPSKEKAQFIVQAIEERGHASIFKELYLKTSDSPIPNYYPTRSKVLPSEHDYMMFANMCTLGESAALKKFIEIHKILPKSAFKSGLHQIIKDEVQHSNQFKEIKIDHNIKRQWIKNNFLSLGVRASETLINTLLFVIYYLILVPLSSPVSLYYRIRK